MKLFRYFIVMILAMWALMIQGQANAAVGVAPSYQDNFSNYLTQWEPDSKWRVEVVYDLGIDSDKSLKDNIRCLFYPNSYMVPWCWAASTGGKIWDIFRYIWFAILVIYIVMAWVTLLLEWDSPDKVTESLKSLFYMLYWALLFFGVTWILWWVLWIETVQWTQGLVNWLQSWPDSLFFKIITTFKTMAFFLAIIMLVIYGFRILSQSDKADKIKTMITWIINIVIALVIIKVIDYVYYIAQLPSFTQKATEFIIEIAKILWFIMWATLVLMIFYAWFLMLTDQWKSENMKKAKDVIVWVVLAGLVVFILLLIMYQIFAEFA